MAAKHNSSRMQISSDYKSPVFRGKNDFLFVRFYPRDNHHQNKMMLEVIVDKYLQCD